MAAYFFDSSALVKRYSIEVGTTWVIKIVSPTSGNQIYIAAITGVEVFSAITRQSHGHISPADVAQLIADLTYDYDNAYSVVDVSPAIIRSAMAIARAHALRGYDAVQLATALSVNRRRLSLRQDPVTLVSADNALNTAAMAEGLAVDNPNSHP